jgi:hypothetical protein
MNDSRRRAVETLRRRLATDPSLRKTLSRASRASYPLRAARLIAASRTPEARYKRSVSKARQMADPRNRQHLSDKMKAYIAEHPEFRLRILETLRDPVISHRRLFQLKKVMREMHQRVERNDKGQIVRFREIICAHCKKPFRYASAYRRFCSNACNSRHQQEKLRPVVKPKIRRACLCCGNEFSSEGAHNRLCSTCRTRSSSPYEP